MNRWTVLMAMAAFIALVALGCSGGSATNPVAPNSGGNLTAAVSQDTSDNTVLWGYYDITIDIENQTVEAVPNRSVQFAANVVDFLNSNPLGLGFNILETPAGANYVDVDINVSLTHPLSGMSQYNGYDVRGVFIGDGSKTMKYNTDLKYANIGTDQAMLADPDDQLGGPDGYTRWFNPKEFTAPGLFGFTPGKFATPAYSATATLNAYKYFADGLGATDDLWTFLNTTPNHGVFASGNTNTRNYYLRFPNAKGIKYSYAVVAGWKGEAPADHPANVDESVGISVNVTPDIYYVDNTNKGGDLILDVDVFNWGAQPSTIFVESSVLNNPHQFDASEMIPTGGTGTYSTYHTEISADHITGTTGQEFWVICQYDSHNYNNEFGVPNTAGTDKLAACFRNNLFVADVPYNVEPICDVDTVQSMPYIGTGAIDFDTSGSSDPDGTIASYEWDFDGDGNYGESPDDDYTGTPDAPTHTYTSGYVGDVNLRITDDDGATSECSVAVDITICIPTELSYFNQSFLGTYDSSLENISGFSTFTGDDSYQTVTVPFTYTYNGTAYTSVSIGTNGWVGLGSTYAGYIMSYCYSGYANNYIQCVSSDLYPGSGGNGAVRYGSSTYNGWPVFVIEWYHCPYYFYGGSVTAQLVLFDTCNVTNDPFMLNVGTYTVYNNTAQAGWYNYYYNYFCYYNQQNWRTVWGPAI